MPFDLFDRLFINLAAEYEMPWLADIYVPPANFPAMAGMRSLVIFGDQGAGKTALGLMLLQESQRNPAAPILPVQWQPSLRKHTPTGQDPLSVYAEQALEACSLALLRHIGNHKQAYLQAPSWVQEIVLWLWHHYLRPTPQRVLNRFKEEIDASALRLLTHILTEPPAETFHDDTPYGHIIMELSDAIQHFGMQGVWLLLDVTTVGSSVNEADLKDLLSTLAYFEAPHLAIKIVVPSHMESALLRSRGVLRRRLDVQRLVWTVEELRAILIRRLARVLEDPDAQLDKLGEGSGIGEFVEKHGGRNPREWLLLAKPFVEAYLLQSMREQRPLSANEIQDICRKYPPRLRMTDQGELYIGGVIQSKPSPDTYEYKVLQYLYRHRGDVCTRERLYYCAYRGKEYPPAVGDDGYEAPGMWQSGLENAVSNLRRTLEPFSGKRVYIVTKRGAGYVLYHAE